MLSDVELEAISVNFAVVLGVANPDSIIEELKSDLKDFSYDNLASPSTKINSIFNKSEINNILKLGTSLNANKIQQHQLWLILVLEIWFKKWDL